MMGALWRPLPLVVMSLSLSAAMFWPQIMSQLPDLSSQPEYQLSWSDIHISAPSRWIPINFAAQVQQQSELPETLNLLDPALAKQLAQAFAHHPWVSGVTSVEKRHGGVDVTLTYRKPVLMVQTPRGLYPVDIDAVLLPPADFTASDVELFPRVEHVRSTPQGPAGTLWGDDAVAGAARLAARLTQEDDHQTPWSRYGLSSIVVLSQPGPVSGVDDVLFGLITKTGSRIIWGHAPQADALEPTVEQKLERLDKYLADNGAFEYRNQPVKIDITDWEVIHWEVLTQSPGTGIVR